MIGKTARTVMLIAAAVLVIGAVVLNFVLDSRGGYTELITALEGFGYTVEMDDVILADSRTECTVDELLEEADKAEGVSASGRAGFPSDIYKSGTVDLLLVVCEEADTGEPVVITLFVLDGSIELAFVQYSDEDGTVRIKALGES